MSEFKQGLGTKVHVTGVTMTGTKGRSIQLVKLSDQRYFLWEELLKGEGPEYTRWITEAEARGMPACITSNPADLVRELDQKIAEMGTEGPTIPAEAGAWREDALKARLFWKTRLARMRAYRERVLEFIPLDER